MLIGAERHEGQDQEHPVRGSYGDGAEPHDVDPEPVEVERPHRGLVLESPPPPGSESVVKLELRGITKAFGPLVANDRIDLTVEPGQIHALLDENDAGKSTLMNVLYGLYQPDAGQILIDDEPVAFSGPGDAVAAGIGKIGRAHV